MAMILVIVIQFQTKPCPIGVNAITNQGLANPDVKEIMGKIEREEVSGGNLLKCLFMPAFAVLVMIALISF